MLATEKKALYHRSTDEDILSHVGTFPLVSSEELSVLTGRNVISLRKRLRQLTHAGYLNRMTGNEERKGYFEEITCTTCGTVNTITRQGGKMDPAPYFYFLSAKGEREALNYVTHAVSWEKKSRNIIDHDRGITLIHLALHTAFGDISDWRQTRDEMKESVLADGEKVSFFADARFSLNGKVHWVEYCHSDPSSRNGETDNVIKVRRYNELLKTQSKGSGSVIFIFRTRAHVAGFLRSIEEKFPYLWCLVADMESVKHNPAGKIFWSPHDFDERTHGLIEQEI